MNELTLYAGASIMIILGLIFEQPSSVSVGLGLMWIGFAIEP